jgi:hypothetical protein
VNAFALCFAATDGLRSDDTSREVVKSVQMMEELLARSGCEVYAYINADSFSAIDHACDRLRTVHVDSATRPSLVIVHLCGLFASIAGDDGLSLVRSLQQLRDTLEDLGGTLFLVADFVDAVEYAAMHELLYVNVFLRARMVARARC